MPERARESSPLGRLRGVCFVLLLLVPFVAACGDRDRASAPPAPPAPDAREVVAVSEPPVGPPVYAPDGSRLDRAQPPSDLPNLVVLVIDALRHDALAGVDPYGDVPPPASPHMPFLDSVAARGLRFDQAVAPAPWTLPSLVSLFTGLLPSRHFQCHPEGTWAVPDSVTTYAEILHRGYGYETAAFVNGTWFRNRPDSLLQGFAYKRTSFGLQGFEDEVGAWNEKRDRKKPFFLMLHTMEAHDPYGQRNHPWPPVNYLPAIFDEKLLTPEAEAADVFRESFLKLEVAIALRRRLGDLALRDVLQRYKYRGYAEDPRPWLAQELRDAYWAGVRWVDDLVARTWTGLEAMGLLENTLVVVTSDHGEAFGDHGNLAHGLCLYDDLIRLPMVMVGPEPFTGGKVVESQIGLIDLLPTFMDWAGISPLTGVTGRSALQIVHGHDWCRPVVSEEPLTRANTGEDVEAVRLSVRTPKWKYVVTMDLRTAAVREEAYDLSVDPGEREDLGEGTGRISGGVLSDACACPAIESLRDRVWRPDANREGEPAAVQTTPYGSGAPTPRDRPEPCR